MYVFLGEYLPIKQRQQPQLHRLINSLLLTELLIFLLAPNSRNNATTATGSLADKLAPTKSAIAIGIVVK